MHRSLPTRGALALYAVVIVGGLLLLSFGGAVLASPVSVPLLWRAQRWLPSARWQVAAGAVLVLTVAEVVWALVYLTNGEGTVLIWVAPLLGSLVAVGLLRRARRRAGVQVSR